MPITSYKLYYVQANTFTLETRSVKNDQYLLPFKHIHLYRHINIKYKLIIILANKLYEISGSHSSECL
jgi:hypothetical protein